MKNVRKVPSNVDLLRSVPGLAGIRDRDLARLASGFDELRVAAGSVLAREGRPAHELVIVLAGFAALSVRGVPAGDVDAGGVLGETAVLGAGAHRATAVSRTGMHLLVAGCDGCRRLRDEPAILRLIARDLARRFAGTSPDDGRVRVGGWRLTG